MDVLSDNGEEPDVVILVGKKRFYCHRDVLSKKSLYFQAMFSLDMKEKNQTIINLKDVEPTSAKILFDYAYSGNFNITNENIHGLLLTSDMLQFEDVRTACVTYLRCKLCLQNCLNIMHMTSNLGIHSLHLEAKQMALWEFSAIVEQNEFLELSKNKLEEYLLDDGLRVKNEMIVFSALIAWVNHSKHSRLEDLYELLHVVRFGQLCINDITKMCREKILKEATQVYDLLKDIWFYKRTLECRGSLKTGSSSLSSGGSSGRSSRSHSNESPGTMSKASSSSSLNSISSNSQKGKGNTDLDQAFIEDPEDPPCKLRSGSIRKRTESTGSIKRNVRLKKSMAKDISSADNRPTSFDEYCYPQCINSVDDMNSFCESSKLLAIQLVNTKPRKIPLVPAVIGHIFVDEESKRISAPDLAIYEESKNEIVRLGSIGKVLQTRHLAVGYKACIIGHEIYVVGGEFFYGHNKWNLQIWKYNTFQNIWTFVTVLEQPRRHHGVVVLSDNIYIIGGVGKFRIPLSSVEVFNIATGVWKSAASLPSAIYLPICTTYKQKIYTLNQEVYRYDAKFNNWTQVRHSKHVSNKLPQDPGLSIALDHESGIFVITQSSELIKYDPESTDSDSKPYTIVGKFQTHVENACIVEDKIYAFSADAPLVVEMYDIVSNAFKVECRTNLNAPSPNLGCFPVPRYIL